MRLKRWRRAAAIALVAASVAGGACKSAPVPAPVVTPPPVPLERKLGWVLRLEQQRTLRDADIAPAAAPVAESVPAPNGPGTFAPAAVPALDRLARDPDPVIRRRAVIAIGRVGMLEGVPALVSALQDPEAEIRAAAAFALGLLGPDAREGTRAMRAGLEDSSLVVRARIIEGLGLIGDAATAADIASTAAGCGAHLAPLSPDEEGIAGPPEVEICRLAIFALARLRDYERLAELALTPEGQPVSRWWPVAYALQRVGDPRATPALLALATTPGVNTAGFALRGLGTLKERAAVPIAKAAAASAETDVKVRIAAVRALGQIGGPAAIEPLLELLGDPLPENMAVEIVSAVGTSGHARAFDVVIERLADPSPAMRAAALTAAARLSPDAFLLVLSGLNRDPEWWVRGTLATVLGTFPSDRVVPALEDLLKDEDARVHGPALDALAAVKAPGLSAHLFTSLEAADFMERTAAARLIGESRPDGGAARLAAAYARGQSDSAYAARAAALEALSKYGGDIAMATLREALGDRDWPVRWRAAMLLHTLGDRTAAPVRPAPLRQPADFFESADLLQPRYSPHAFIETARGTIEVELNVVDAPITARNFMDLARAGFFNGMRVHRLVPTFVIQAGDPRGDGEGGPGYAIPDELNWQPYLRGTMGMALDWRDTAGSQWFITLSPQPHLDAKYTAFGRVVNGWDVLDRLAPWDVIERVRIWDGVTFN
jgi:HEAT repeat protein/cyclophilin family peptidyl-prolyl cis-trans isomerase